jgi:ribosome-binding factor A
MSKKKYRPRRRFDRPLCAALGPDDGVDPRDWVKGERGPVKNRKALQLCRQVAQTLHLALAGCADPWLNDLLVLDVTPFPDSTRLLVTVQSATGTATDPAAVSERVRQAAAMLRREVASAIHRRKTPDLLFRVAC